MRRCVILGFGAVAQSTFPLIDKNLPVSEYLINDVRQLDESDLKCTEGTERKIEITKIEFTPETIFDKVYDIVKDHDMVFDFMGCVDSISVILACAKREDVLYLNACLEEWEGQCLDSEYELYAKMNKSAHLVKSTTVLDAGANPGVITHFAILGTRHMAQSAIDRDVEDAGKLKELLEHGTIAELATQLQIEQVHISEIEKIEPASREAFDGFTTNSWCVPSFHEEWNKCSEVSIGSSDKEILTSEGYTRIEGQEPPSTAVPYPLHLWTASPTEKFIGRCVRHPETIEISELFYDRKADHVATVAFVYHPSPLPLEKMRIENWRELPTKIMAEYNAGPLDGSETMGALLISKREDIPPRWYGSILSCEQTRECGCLLNPTTLQVAASAYAHMMFAVKNPDRGLCMPHDFDSDEVMKYAAPYLGTVWDGDLDFRLPATWKELLTDEKVE